MISLEVFKIILFSIYYSMSTMEFSEELVQKIKDHIKHHELIYVDYRDSFDENLDVAQEIIDTGHSDKIWDWYNDHEWDSTREILEDIQKEFDLSDDDMEEAHDRLVEIIQDTCSNDPVPDLCNNTGSVPIRLEALSNYEGFRWDYNIRDYEYSLDDGFTQIVDLLMLDPQTLKKKMMERGYSCIGKWPTIKSRIWKEYVLYDEFITELNNTTSNCNCLTFVGTADLRDFYNCTRYGGEKEWEKIIVTIPKGNSCGLFDSGCGGWSLVEMELLRDFTVDVTSQWGDSSCDVWRFGIDDDKAIGWYSINDVYGVTKQFYGSEISVEFKP